MSCRNLTVKESVFVMTDNPPTDRPFGSPWRSIMKINNWKKVPQLQQNEIRWIFQETIIYYSNLAFVFWRHRKCLENLFNCMYLIGSKHNWFDQFRGCIFGYAHVLIGCRSLMGCPVLTSNCYCKPKYAKKIVENNLTPSFLMPLNQGSIAKWIT